jgi:hypothetical protein
MPVADASRYSSGQRLGCYVWHNVIKLANRFVRHRKPFDPSGLVARIAATRAERFDSA